MNRLFPGLMLLLILLLVCTPLGAQEDRLSVVATHSILADVVQHVAGDAADVTSLLPLNADPHSYTPTPRELVSLANADVVIVNGVSYEEGLLESIENAAEDITIVQASQCVEVLPFGQFDAGDHQDNPSDGPCAAHHDEVQITHHEESLGLLINLDCDEGCDPHVWMNPQNVMLWTLTIRDTLSELDPANAEVYAQNAAAYIVELSELQREIESMLQAVTEQNRVLVTNHDSLGYFAAQFGFEVVGVVIPGGSTVAEPSAQDIVGLIEAIEAHRVLAVFAEASINPDLAQEVADESGANLYTLYSGSLSDAASTYIDYMRYNVRTIVDGLG